MSIATHTPVVLAQAGMPQVSLVLPASACAAEEYAAEELRRHLYTLVGAGLPLRRREGTQGAKVFLNDRTAAEAAGIDVAAMQLAPEAFHLETRDGNLYLLGGGPRGVLYGVYDVLEALGCRWFAPEVSRIPRCDRLELPPLCKTAAPAFEFRDTFNWDVSDPTWWVRNRMNGWYTAVPDYMGGHMTYGMFVHTFDVLVPPAEFFAGHPEYFSQIDGMRRREHSQLCLTNPEVLRIVTERVLERMRHDPKATIFSVSQNDCEGYCQCPQCRAVAEEEGSQSGPLLRFVNAVAAETAKVFPDKLIDTLAYWYSLDAPRHAVPHPNVRVRLCPIRCCQGHAFGTCDHPESARFLRALNGWSQVTEQMYIWHYCTNFAHYPLPMPDFDELHANINLYKRYGVYGVFMQGMGEEGGGAESMALRGYVISKLLWNPDQPVWPLIDEFLAGYYGAAAPNVRVYLDTFHQQVRERRDLHPSLYDPPTSPLFDEEIVAPADAALTAGEAQVHGDERLRVRLLRDGLAYARLFRTCGAFRREGDVFLGDATEDDCQAFDQMVCDWQQAGILRTQEGAPLEVSLAKLRNRLTAHPVKWLRDGEQSIAVVPELGGSLLEWHALGHQWLAPPDPENQWMLYPMSAGYREFAVLGMYAFQGWAEPFHCRQEQDALVLELRINEQLQMERRLEFRHGVLHIASRIVNNGTAPASCGWGAGLHLALPGAARMSFQTAAGEQRFTWDELPDGLGAAKSCESDQLPLGAWQVDMPGYRLTQQFSGEPIVRAILGKVDASHTLALDLRTDMLQLAPGQAIEMQQQLWIADVPPA